MECFVSLKIIVISILGSVVQLIILQRIITFLLFSYEVIRNIVLMNKLSLLLYQRYFDARFHEYHPSSVVAYYKRSYFEFRIASSLYIISILFHTISLFIESFYPFILMILTNPKWLQHVYNIPIEKHHFVSSLKDIVVCQPNHGYIIEYIFVSGIILPDYTIFLSDIVLLLQVTEESVYTEELYVSF